MEHSAARSNSLRQRVPAPSGLRLHGARQPLAPPARLELPAEGIARAVPAGPLIDHVLDLVMNVAEKVVVLNFGQKLAEGTPAEVQANPKVRTAYLGTKEEM